MARLALVKVKPIVTENNFSNCSNINNSANFIDRTGKILIKGSWNILTSWEFIVSKQIPPIELCTAVFCVTSYQRKLLLTSHLKRGWELPGGHLDEGEGLIQGATREVLEETGAIIEKPVYFGYKKVTAVKPVPHLYRIGEFYPFPYSYVPYFYGDVSEILNINLSKDIESMGFFGLKDSARILNPVQGNLKIVRYLIAKKAIKIND